MKVDVFSGTWCTCGRLRERVKILRSIFDAGTKTRAAITAGCRSDDGAYVLSVSTRA